MTAWGLLLLLFCHWVFADQEVTPKDPTPIVKEKNPDGGLHIGFGGAYTFNGLMKFDPVTVPDSTITEETTAEWRFTNAGAIDVEIRYLNPYSLGFTAGAVFDEQRRMSTAKFTGTTMIWFFYPMIDVNIKVTTYYVNASYRSEEFYLIAGANYGSVQMSSPTVGFEEMKTKGGVGWQYGIGYYVTEDIVIELMNRKTTYELRMDYPDGSPIISFGKGGFTSTSFGAKYIF